MLLAEQNMTLNCWVIVDMNPMMTSLTLFNICKQNTTFTTSESVSTSYLRLTPTILEPNCQLPLAPGTNLLGGVVDKTKRQHISIISIFVYRLCVLFRSIPIIY